MEYLGDNNNTAFTIWLNLKTALILRNGHKGEGVFGLCLKVQLEANLINARLANMLSCQLV